MQIKKYWRELTIFLCSVSLRVPRLGTDIFNADAFRWKTRSYNFSNGLFNFDFSQTAQVAHPGVVLMWIGTAGIKVYNAFNEFFRSAVPSGSQQILELHFVQKLLVVITLSFLFAFSFFLLRKLTNPTIAFFSVLLLSLEPYFLAHTRVFHLDALLSMFMFVSVLLLLCYFDSLRNSDGEVGSEFPKAKLWRNSLKLSFFPSLPTYLFFSAFFAGLALLTKITALFLIPFVGLLMLLDFLLKKDRPAVSLTPAASLWKEYCLPFVIWVLVLAVTFSTLWPAMWVQPIKTFQLYFQGVSAEGFAGHGNYFWGQWTTNPGWTFYPMSLWIRLSPWLLVLGGWSIFGFFRDIVASLSPGRSLTSAGATAKHGSPRSEKPEFPQAWVAKTKPRLVSFGLLFLILFLIFITIPSKKLERYTLPTYPFLAVLGGFGVYYLCAYLRALFTSRENSKSNPPARFAKSRRAGGPSSKQALNVRNFLKNPGLFITAGLIFLFVSSTYKIFPDYLAYHSALVGGLQGAVSIIRPDWSIGAWRVGQWLNEQPRKKPLLDVVVPQTEQFRPFIEGRVEDSRFTDKKDFGKYDYVIFPVWSERNSEFEREPVKIVRIAGTAIYNIYRFEK